MKAQLTQSVDVKTNETIKRCAVPEHYIKEIEDKIKIHQENLNNFMIMSQQLAELNHRWLKLRQDINGSDKGCKEKMQFACKKLRLQHDDGWTYHLTDKCFELRTPPDMSGFEPQMRTASQLAEGGKDGGNGEAKT